MQVGRLPKDAQGQAVFNRLETARARAGLSRADLADAVGVHYQTVGYLERGEYSPSLALALRISRLLGLAVEELFSLEPIATAIAPGADPAGPARAPTESIGAGTPTIGTSKTR